MIKNIFARHRYAPVAWLSVVAILISFLTRLALLIGFSKSIDAGFLSIVWSFVTGMFFDIVTTAFIVIPLTLQITFANDFVYTKTGKWFGMAFFVIVLYVLLFT